MSDQSTPAGPRPSNSGMSFGSFGVAANYTDTPAQNTRSKGQGGKRMRHKMRSHKMRSHKMRSHKRRSHKRRSHKRRN